MINQFKIASHLADEYCSKSTCTVDINLLDFIQIDGRVIKDEIKTEKEYVTIQANDGGTFSSEWDNSELKILFILRESYILKDSFYLYGDRGGHCQNKEYVTNNHLWDNPTYRNLVKITFFAYHSMLNIPLKDVDFKHSKVWDEACDIFRKHAAVISANPFPGLAFNSTNTDLGLLKQWLGIADVQDFLKEKIHKLNPKRIYAAFDLGLISSYPHLFGWLKGRSLNELIDIEGEQSVFGANVVCGGAANGCAYAVDNTGLVWIQGVHPASRLSHKKMINFASALVSHQ